MGVINVVKKYNYLHKCKGVINENMILLIILIIQNFRNDLEWMDEKAKDSRNYLEWEWFLPAQSLGCESYKMIYFSISWILIIFPVMKKAINFERQTLLIYRVKI